MSKFKEGDRVRLIADEYENFDDFGLEIGMLGTVQACVEAGEFAVLVDGFEEEWDFVSSELEVVL